MTDYIDLNKDGYYGLVIIDPRDPTIGLYHDEDLVQIEHAPKLVYHGDDEMIRDGKGIHFPEKAKASFYQHIDNTATSMMKPIRNELDGILLAGPSPMKYEFIDLDYLEGLQDITGIVDGVFGLDENSNMSGTGAPNGNNLYEDNH